MNELFEKLDNLKEELDSSELVKDLKRLQDEIKKDSALMSLIEEYSLKPSESLKMKILEKDVFQEFKEKETELNLFIMELNKRLKVISKSEGCHHESN